MVPAPVSLEWNAGTGPVVVLECGNRRIGLCFCHRRKDRSIWFFGLEKFLCSRCLGILLGGMAGLACVLLPCRIDPAWSLLLLLPLVIDGLLQLVRQRESTNAARLVTGFLFGFGLQLFLAAFFAFAKNQILL